IRQDELVRRFLSATADARKVITDANAGYYGIEVNDQSLVPGHNARLGSIRFAEWLSRNTQKLAEQRSASNLSAKLATVIALLLCGIGIGALSLHGVAADDASTKDKEAKLTELFSKDLTDLPGKEGLMLMVEYPPGSLDPIHRHNAHGFIY